MTCRSLIASFELAEPGGELVDPGLGLPGLAGQCLLPRVDPVQQEPARVRAAVT